MTRRQHETQSVVGHVELLGDVVFSLKPNTVELDSRLVDRVWAAGIYDDMLLVDCCDGAPEFVHATDCEDRVFVQAGVDCASFIT